jgi:transcriptional regulator with XRE-family HTH domain
MDMQSTGAAIRAARRAAHRTQGELAAALGMSRATISGIENGTVHEIGVRKLAALCAAVGLEVYVGPKRERPTLQQLLEEQRATRRRT